MKPKSVLYNCLALLIAASAQIHASPSGEGSPSKNSLHVLSESGLTGLSTALVSEYNQSSQLEPVTMAQIDESTFMEQFRQEGTIALHVFHMSGDCTIATGVDDASRGGLVEGILGVIQCLVEQALCVRIKLL